MVIPFSSGDVSAPASDTAAVVTYAAVSDKGHVITGIAWSYTSAPTGGQLKIEDGAGNNVFMFDITAAGPGVVYFTPPKRGTTNTDLIVTLAAGGTGISGKVSVIGHSKE